MTQATFAALAGATKGAQIKWEKDQASPNAVALVAFAEAGADVLYILSGRRSGEPFSIRAEADVQTRLDEIESVLGWNGRGTARGREGLTGDEVATAARIALTKIATSTSPDVSEPARERADEVLRLHFDDGEAGKRRSARFASHLLRQKSAGQDLKDIFEGAEIIVGRDLHHSLYMLMTDYQVSRIDMLNLVASIRAELQRVAADT